jgi:hypothetical protein
MRQEGARRRSTRLLPPCLTRFDRAGMHVEEIVGWFDHAYEITATGAGMSSGCDTFFCTLPVRRPRGARPPTLAMLGRRHGCPAAYSARSGLRQQRVGGAKCWAVRRWGTRLEVDGAFALPPATCCATCCAHSHHSLRRPYVISRAIPRRACPAPSPRRRLTFAPTHSLLAPRAARSSAAGPPAAAAGRRSRPATGAQSRAVAAWWVHSCRLLADAGLGGGACGVASRLCWLRRCRGVWNA